MVYDKGIISSIRKLGKNIKERRLKPKLSDQPLLDENTNPELATKAKFFHRHESNNSYYSKMEVFASTDGGFFYRDERRQFWGFERKVSFGEVKPNLDEMMDTFY